MTPEAKKQWNVHRLEQGDIPHGTSGYVYGCRCEICTRAHRTYAEEYCSRRLTRGDFTHGTHLGYQFGCRCRECLDANTAYYRAYWHEYYKRKKGAEM